jgi:hypothetical protein
MAFTELLRACVQRPEQADETGEHLSLKGLVRAKEPINGNGLSEPLHTGSEQSVGVDLGVKSFVALSTSGQSSILCQRREETGKSTKTTREKEKRLEEQRQSPQETRLSPFSESV